ncbi:MAG: sulfatase-like hydrolase/transferase [Gemmatimonadetes bacterium]|nr:sulfatase-like hydrolase/transferase [Gemmatimonadota bacterium]
MGEHGLFFKHCSYEGAIGVPLVITGPGIPEGEVNTDTPVSLIDLYPTILDMAGLDPEPGLPGASWLPLVRGEPHKRSERVFAEWHGPQLRGAYYMIVRGDYKYTWYEFHPPSLFNVKEDPKEERDLASDIEQADRLRAFKEELRSIVDPKATALRAKRDLGLIAPDGTDMTDSLIPWAGFEDGTLEKVMRADSARHRRS